MKIIVVTLVLLGTCIHFSCCSPTFYFGKRAAREVTTEKKDFVPDCDKATSEAWARSFHDQFFHRKYADGGKDLNNIVDRIMNHAEESIKISKKECLPTYDGFFTILDKVISQMKDYVTIYLEDIHHGKEDIKDLKCVEESLSIKNYKKCFANVYAETDDQLKVKMEEGIMCADKKHKECSKAAKRSINNIVRTILNLKQPVPDDVEDKEDKPEPPPPPPKKWYDYIIQPFISLWKAITSLFS